METLRLYPSVPGNFKLAVELDTLPDGTVVKPGDMVTWSPWIMGRSLHTWGADVMKFNPYRWIQKDQTLLKPSPFIWPAFHAGPRTCLGQRMATLEAVATIARLCHSYRFELADTDKERFYGTGITLGMRDPLNVRIFFRIN